MICNRETKHLRYLKSLFSLFLLFLLLIVIDGRREVAFNLEKVIMLIISVVIMALLSKSSSLALKIKSNELDNEFDISNFSHE